MAPDPDAVARGRGLLADLVQATASRQPDLPAYLNFAEGEERRALLSEALDPAGLERVRAVKARVDPQGLFAYGLL